MVALVDGVPRTLSLREVHRRLRRRTSARSSSAARSTSCAEKEARAHILEGLLIALDNLDAVIELIRASRDRETARDELDDALRAHRRSRRRRSSTCACRSSPRSSPTRSSSEHADVIERIRELRELLGDEARVLGAHQGGAAARSPSASATSAARRSPPSEDELDIEDLIADQQMVITITQVRLHQVAAAGHLPPAAPRRRRRDRDGHEGRRLHRAPLRVLDARLPAVLLQPRQGLPLEGLRAAGGAAHGEGPRARQRPAAARGRADPVRALHARLHRVASTSSSPRAKGIVKKTEFAAYNTPIKADGIIAIKIRDDDELVAVRRVDAATTRSSWSPRAGLAVRFARGQARARWAATPAACAAWTSRGKGNEVIAMDVARDDMDLLVVTENGFGKRTPIDRVPQDVARRQGRARRSSSPRRKGGLAGALVVRAAPGARLHLRRRAWCSARACAGITPARAARRRA